MNATVQIIHKDGCPEWAVIPYDEYERLTVLAENHEDIRAFDEAIKAVEAGEELIPSAVVDRLADGEPALKVWREYRGFTPTVLAECSGVEEACLVRMESNIESVSPELLTSLAKILQVDANEFYRSHAPSSS